MSYYAREVSGKSCSRKVAESCILGMSALVVFDSQCIVPRERRMLASRRVIYVHFSLIERIFGQMSPRTPICLLNA